MKFFSFLLGTLSLAGLLVAVQAPTLIAPVHAHHGKGSHPAFTLTPARTATVTATATPTATPSGHPNYCHAPTTHTHFDCEPQWVTNYITANPQIFGGQTRVIYGGDEASSPAENTMKHNCFKGHLLRYIAPNGLTGEVYHRNHACSNPMDRASQPHSQETYIRDTSGGVSFLQGHYDTGDPETRRICIHLEPQHPNTRPVIFVTCQADLDAGIYDEQWYYQIGFGADVSYRIGHATTIYQPGENATAHDMSTWYLNPHGTLGLWPTISWFIYRIPWAQPDGAFCATPQRVIVPCGTSGSLPQYFAPTLWADINPATNRIEANDTARAKPLSCPQCQVPN